MKKEIILLVLGMILVIVGALLKITNVAASQYVLLVGLAIEAFVLTSIVIKSLKKVK